MFRERPVTWLLLALVLGGIGLSVWRWRAEEAEVRERIDRQAQRREDRAREQLEERAEFISDLRRESGELMPDMLEGVALGMSEEELRERRPALRPHTGANDPSMEFLSERLSNGSQIVYGLVPDTSLLARVQVMSILPSPGAMGAHLTAMLETYGRPTGIWNCPDTGGVPTRRFTWRRAETAIADIFLIYGERISVTLDIAPSQTIGASLRRASCQPIQSRDELGEFPAATVEQIMAAQEDQADRPLGP